MSDTLLNISLFLLASILIFLLTLRLTINFKHLYLFFHSLPLLMDVLKFWRCPFILTPPGLLNLTKISDPPPIYFDHTPFIRHLRVIPGLAFKTESIINISLNQFSVWSLLKIFLYLVILTVSLTLNLRGLGLVSVYTVKAE